MAVLATTYGILHLLYNINNSLATNFNDYIMKKLKHNPDPQDDNYCIDCGMIYYNCLCGHDDDEE